MHQLEDRARMPRDTKIRTELSQDWEPERGQNAWPGLVQNNGLMY